MRPMIRSLIVGVSLMCSQMVSAQTPDPDPLDQPGIVLLPSVTVTTAVDSNVFHEDIGPKSDLLTTFAPSLAGSVRRGRLAFVGHGRLAFVHFNTYNSERSIDTDSDARLDLQVGRLRPFVAVSVLNTRQRLELEIDERARRFEKSITAGVNVRLTGKTSFESSINRETREFDRDAVFLGSSLSGSLNRTSNTLAGALYVAVTPLTTIAVGAIESTEHHPIGSFRDLQTFRLDSRVYFSPRAALSGRASVGYRHSAALATPLRSPAPLVVPVADIDPVGSPSIAVDEGAVATSLGDFSGAVAAIDIAYRIRYGTTVTLSVDRDLSQSFRIDLPTYVFNEFGSGILQEITGHWRVRGRFLRQQYDYRPGEGILLNIVPGNEPSERVFLGHAGLEYRPRRNAGIEFGLDKYVRHSRLSERRAVSGFLFGVSFSYGLGN
jgi:hypothetical protein